MLPKVKQWLPQNHHEFTLQVAKSRQELMQAAKEASANGYDAVLAMGGDGTIHDVATAVMNQDIAVGHLPGGRGNDFPRNMGYSLDLKTVCEGLRNPIIETIDLPVVNGHACLSIAGVGFDSLVAERVRDGNCKLGGTICYFWTVFQVLAGFQPLDFTVTIDDDTVLKGKYTLVAVANSMHFGGGMKIAPHADNKDGVLDVVYADGMTKLRLIQLFLKIYQGKHIKEPEVHCLQAKKVMIESSRNLKLFAEGEYISDMPVTIELSDRKMKVVVPGN